MKKIISIVIIVVLAVVWGHIELLHTSSRRYNEPTIIFEGFIPPVEGKIVDKGDGLITLLFTSPINNSSNVTKVSAIVTVRGSHTVELEGRIFRITIVSMVEAIRASEAVMEVAKEMNSIVSALVSLGIPKEEVYTVSYSLTPCYDYDYKPPRLVGYRAQHTIAVEVEDKEIAAKAIDLAVEAGADRVSIAFTVPKEVFESAYEEALYIAVQKAYKKAQLIASALNATVVEILRVNEYGYVRYPYTTVYKAVSLEAEKVGTELYKTEVVVIATVQLEVRIGNQA